MRTLINDLRYAARSLSKSPGFTAVALLTLGIGTGVNATVFSFVNALLFRDAPVPAPSTLVAIYTSDFSSGPYGTSSYPDFQTLRAAVSSIETLAAYDGGTEMLFESAGAVERIRTSAVSGHFFSALGISAQAGRLLAEADLAPNDLPAAVISDELWRRAFAYDAGALGATIVLEGRKFAIVGIMPRTFKALDLGQRVDAWVPMTAVMMSAPRGDRFLSIIGRLGNGSSIERAQAEISAIATRLADDFPKTNRGTLQHPDEPRPMAVLHHTRLPPEFRTEVATFSAVLMAAVVMVLLIACANVASLLLSRAAARTREMAVRLALGAARSRLVAQMLSESVLLGACGAALGLLFALWTSDVLPSFFPPEQADLVEAGIDGRVLFYTLGLALASSVLFGLAPAFQALRPAAVLALRTGTLTTEGRGGARLRSLLVVSQIAIATILLVGAALLVRSLTNAINADLGFGAREAVLVSVEQPEDRSEVRGLEYCRNVLTRVRAVPGVAAATVTQWAPLAGGSRRGFRPEGYTRRTGEDMELPINIVERTYFETMQIPLVEGRAFEDADAAHLGPVIVNDVLARRFFEGTAVGRHLTDSKGAELTIVGVVATSRHRSLQEAPRPLVYYPLGPSYSRHMTIVARTSGDAGRLLSAIKTAAADVDPRVAAYRVTTMEGHVREALTTDRMAALLVSVCGGLALVLAMIGIYGIVRYAVARRTREIGVRVALGARPGQVVALVLLEGMRIATTGLVIGLIGAFGATRALASLLFGIGAADLPTFAAVGAALSLVTLGAALLPARRALRLDPMVVLRDE